MGKAFDIAKFDSYKEDNCREVKSAKGGLPNSLWETYSAFANCHGGVIILGASEQSDGTWQTTGLTNERKLVKEFWDIINNKKKVSCNILSDHSVETFTEPKTGNSIVVISVPAAKRDEKPIYLNNDIMGCTYRRNWEGDYRCTPTEVKAMLRDAPEDSMDMQVLPDVPLSAICKESVEGYKNRQAAYKPGHSWLKLGYEEYLEQIGAAGISSEDHELHPTAAGLLMFGQEVSIVRQFPEYFLDYREMLDPSIRWTDRLHSSSGEWTGNLFDFFFIVYNKLQKELKVPFKIENGIRIDDTPVHKALREALANCLMNADFYLPRAVVIKLYPDKIVLENPGSIRTGKKQMLKGGISDPRNKALMKMFNLINIGERAGSGVPDIYSVWNDADWIAPRVEEQYGPDRTILTLPLSSKQLRYVVKDGTVNDTLNVTKNVTKKVTKTRASQIIALIKNDAKISTENMASILDVNKRTILRDIEKLMQAGKIKRIGPLKGGHWEVVDL